MRYIITLALTATPAFAEVPRVVTDIPPVHALVAQVMGDLGEPVLLLARGADEHDFQLKPSQARSVAEAGLVVWIGPGLTPWLDSALSTRPDGAAALALLDAEGTMRRAYDEGDDHDHDDHDDHAAEAGEHDHAHDGHDTAHDGHDHGSTDPHAWLDPDNAQVWLGLIAVELGRLDPGNAAVYAGNAVAAAERVAVLDGEVAALLAPVRDKPIVTYHDAFGYFADHYGLNVVGSISEGDAASPGAARLSDLRRRVAAGEVLCLFPEAQHDPALVAQMAEGTGARIGGALDPVGSSHEAGPGAYAALLTGLAQVIADCAAAG
jgi:zinc transport system substrate-binding protein